MTTMILNRFKLDLADSEIRERMIKPQINAQQIRSPHVMVGLKRTEVLKQA